MRGADTAGGAIRCQMSFPGLTPTTSWSTDIIGSKTPGAALAALRIRAVVARTYRFADEPEKGSNNAGERSKRNE